MKNPGSAGVAAVLLAACTGDGQGTSVGNPNLTVLRIAEPGEQVALDTAAAFVDQVFLTDASGDRAAVDVGIEGDLVEGIPLELPRGEYSALAVQFAAPLSVSGTSHRFDRVDLELVVPEVRVLAAEPVRLADAGFVFELAEPGWLEPERFGWVAGEDHVVRPGDPEHDLLVGEITRRSALLEDGDRDGRPDPGRDPAAEGEERGR